jgi:nucleotide-binding universal stress UspA family protein
MPDIKHILFPFDFSGQSRHTVTYVRAFAERLGARITLFSVVPPAWSMPPIGMEELLAEHPKEAKQDLKSLLEKTLIEELKGLTVERVAAAGDPAYQITEFAHANGVDLIMMPTHGLGMFRSLLIGSVTSKVLHDAKCPVWTAAHSEKQHAPQLPRTVVCALDGSPRSGELAQWAAAFSQQVGAKLKLLHVVRPVSDWLALESERELQEELRRESRKQVEVVLAKAGIEADVRVAVGEIVETVTEEARQEDAHLVMIGRGTLQAALGRLRTHAYGIIQKSPCPVVSV